MSASMRDTSVHDASMREASMHDASMRDTSMRDDSCEAAHMETMPAKEWNSQDACMELWDSG